MKYDPKNAFGNPELIARMKQRNKRLKKKGTELCPKCDQPIGKNKKCYCL